MYFFLFLNNFKQIQKGLGFCFPFVFIFFKSARSSLRAMNKVCFDFVFCFACGLLLKIAGKRLVSRANRLTMAWNWNWKRIGKNPAQNSCVGVFPGRKREHQLAIIVTPDLR